MSQGAGGERLNRDSRVLKCPRVAEPVDNGTRVVSTAVSMEESTLRFQDVFGAGPAHGREVGGDNAALGRMTRLKRFHHAAEVFTQTGGLAGGNRECAHRLTGVEPSQTGAGRRAAKNAARTGGMKAVLVVPGRDRLRDLALHFKTQLVSQKQVFPALPLYFSGGECGRKHAHSALHQRAIDAILAYSKLR